MLASYAWTSIPMFPEAAVPKSLFSISNIDPTNLLVSIPASEPIWSFVITLMVPKSPIPSISRTDSEGIYSKPVFSVLIIVK